MAYKVQKGDTPSKIANKLGVSVEDVMGVSSAFSTPGNAGTLQIGATIDLEGGDSGSTDSGADKTQQTYTGEEDVRWLEISVYQLLLVRMRKSVK